MNYRRLGRTGLEVSEIGFGAEWMPGDDQEKVSRLVDFAAEQGVNIVDCWMADPAVRRVLGNAVCAHRDKWIVQGHFGATWQNGQYTRTREMDAVIPAWEELLACFGGHIELGLIHFVDSLAEFDGVMARSSSTCAPRRPPGASIISACPRITPRLRCGLRLRRTSR